MNMALTHAAARRSEAPASSSDVSFIDPPNTRSGVPFIVEPALHYVAPAPVKTDHRTSIRSALMLLSFACIIIPLPLIGVMGYFVGGGEMLGAYYTAITAVLFCLVAIGAFFGRRLI